VLNTSGSPPSSGGSDVIRAVRCACTSATPAGPAGTTPGRDEHVPHVVLLRDPRGARLDEDQRAAAVADADDVMAGELHALGDDPGVEGLDPELAFHGFLPQAASANGACALC
jgi:hypothetical protein